ncbi:type II toxin-antitoxin system HicB family antitoxin [Halobaculum sp. MBLA0147]|uniref:type II toxin-antitoxin system HicB family antitoxin n=1 Tax=Halobaculum sp. MBLA0147 TaxID=3079934 RepID=UPI0035253524
MTTRREITLHEEDDGWWSAVDEETGVASQGPNRQAALSNLDEALSVTAAAEADQTKPPEPDAPWFDEHR